jgi:hypothetical protein
VINVSPCICLIFLVDSTKGGNSLSVVDSMAGFEMFV